MKQPPSDGSSGAHHEAAVLAAANIKGIGAITLAMASFSAGDTLMKLAAGHAPTSQLIFMRGVVVTLVSALVCLAVGGFAVWRKAMSLPMGLRALGDIGGGWFFQSALARMQLPDLSAISQLGPLVMTAASAMFLREKVGWRRWTAAFVGLLGVLLIIRPGSTTFNVWSLVGILSVLSGAVRDLSTRFIDRSVHASLIMTLSAAAVTLAALCVAPFGGWVSPEAIIVVQVAGAAVFSLGGQLGVIVAMRSGEVSAVAPFRYTIIPFVILSGLFVFGYLPDMMTMIGIAIVCCAGLYTFSREQQLRRQAMKLHSAGRPAE